MGISAALAGSGTAYDFAWFKTNVMKAKTAGEDKELEALLLKQGYFIDYFDNILLYGEKKRTTSKMNEQHGRWTLQQFQNLLRNIRYLPPDRRWLKRFCHSLDDMVSFRRLFSTLIL